MLLYELLIQWHFPQSINLLGNIIQFPIELILLIPILLFFIVKEILI